MSDSDVEDNNANRSGAASQTDAAGSGPNGGDTIEIAEIADYIAEMLEPLSKLAGETGMELLSLLIDFAAKEAHNIKESHSNLYADSD